jgi:uncharacterized protein (DUF608 family)
MVLYSWKDEIKAGVPLGGIGTGKLEINNRGKLVNITVFGNLSSPIKSVRGFHIFISPDEGDPFFLEKDLRIRNMREVDELYYEGVYPFCYLTGKKGEIKVTLEAFSPIIPRNIKDSNIPAVGLSIKVSGSKKGTIYLSFPNFVGSTSIGRINRKVENGIIFTNIRTNEYDPRRGEVGIFSYYPTLIISQYNINVDAREAFKTFIYKDLYEDDNVWRNINKVKSDEHEVVGFWDDPAGIIASNYEENKEIRFVIAWYSRSKSYQYPYGFYYHNRFSGVLEVAQYFMKNYEELRKRTIEWKERIMSINLPDWLKDAIINSSYILTSSTWLDEKGRFGVLEAPEVFPVVGTIAGLCYEGALPVLLLFPCLEKEFIKELANAIREDGYVPHDLGIWSFDSPIEGTTAPPRWKDLNPTFILLVYRYFKFTGDIDFLREMYPKMLKAYEWMLTRSIEAEGSGDTAFDVLPIKGKNPMLLTLFIASALALRETKKVLNEKDESTDLSKLREMLNSLYNGKYFIAWEGQEGIFMAQLLGEWWTELLGLENVTDEEKISSALRYMLEVNGKVSEYCTPNLVKENGEVVKISPQAYSSWPRLVFAMGWIGSKRDKRWLEIVKKEWDNIIKKGVVWNQPSRVNSINGNPEPENYLDHYIGNPSIWSFIVKEFI